MQSFLIAAMTVSSIVLGAPKTEPEYIAVADNTKTIDEQSAFPRRAFGYYFSQPSQLYVIPELPEEEETNERSGSETEGETLNFPQAKKQRRLRHARRSLLYDLASVGPSVVSPPHYNRGVSGATFTL